MHLLAVFGVFCIVVGLMLAAWAFLGRVWTSESRLRSALINLSISLFALVYLLLALEVYYFLFAIDSDGFGFTLSHRRWCSLYWKPINSLGYRDDEYSAEDLENKRVACVMGDSFAAGSGIKDYRDRFSNVLNEEIGEDWVVVNIAVPGWDTPQELDGLKSYPHKPELVILQYYLNDITPSAIRWGELLMPPYPSLPTPIKPLIEHSYFANHWFWRLYRRLLPKYTQISYWESLKRCFENEEIWQDHERALREFVDYTKQQGMALVVVLFPHPLALQESHALTSRVVELFDGLQVETLDLTPVLIGRDTEEIVCNPFDGHPNEAVHREAAQLLYQRLVTAGILETKESP